MPIIQELDNLRLYKCTTRGYQLRWTNKAGEKFRQQVPADLQGEAQALRYAIEKDPLVKYGLLEKDNKCKPLKEHVSEYYALLDQQVLNYKLGDKYADKIRPARRDCVVSHIKLHILPTLGDLPINMIEPVEIGNLQDDLRQKMLPQTVNPIIGTLSRMLKFFIKKGYIRSNPCRDIDPLRKVDTDPRYTPTKHEVERVINHLDGWKKTMVMLAAGTGLRISEILALEWSNVRGDTISVEASAVKTNIGTPKTKHSRRKVRVDSRLKVRLQEMRLQSTSTFLFLNSNGRLFSSVDVLNRVLYPAIEKADVPKFGFHGLRRFYENELESQGVMKDHIQRLMGHEIGSKVTDKHYRVVRQEEVLLDDYVIEVGV
ncbi:MAG TPA: hypothetical protein DCY55_11035 [Gammaproteobacteria bacterium]|nr:hypothetical protein [Gammaproteobacteria bacterium]